MELAVAECHTTMASLFVNPLQFNDAGDLARYPRDLDRDADIAAAAGIDVLFAPPLEEMYPDLASTRVNVDSLTLSMEGALRPGHFEGVATVVAKLFAGLQPDRAFFGRKDAQQLAVVTRMVRDLSFPIVVVGGSTVRESDGLALSSRNVFLSDSDRVAATALSRALFSAADAAEAGERSGAALEGIVSSVLSDTVGIAPQYAELTDAADVVRLQRLHRPAFLAVAATVGALRLIDNVFMTPQGDGVVIDRGVRLEETSMLYGGR